MARENNVPVNEPMAAKVADRFPMKKAGDMAMRALSPKKMAEYGSREGMYDVTMNVLRKAILCDKDGKEVWRCRKDSTLENGDELQALFVSMEDKVPYVIKTQSGKNIGWFMRKEVPGVGVGTVGRIYNSNIDDYDMLKNDPDRPVELLDVDFNFEDIEDEDLKAKVSNLMPIEGRLIRREAPEGPEDLGEMVEEAEALEAEDEDVF